MHGTAKQNKKKAEEVEWGQFAAESQGQPAKHSSEGRGHTWRCTTESPHLQEQEAGALAGGLSSAGPGLSEASCRQAVCRKWSVSVAIGEERLYTGKSTTTGWRQFRLWLLTLTLGHKENSDHLEGSLGHSQTEGPWEREKEITCSNDESSKQRFDKKEGGRKKSKQQQGKGASKKNIATEHMKILARKLRKHSEETSGKRWKQ